MKRLIIAGLLLSSAPLWAEDATQLLAKQALPGIAASDAASLARLRELTNRRDTLTRQINALGMQMGGKLNPALITQRGELLKQRDQVDQQIKQLNAQRGIYDSTFAHNHEAATARLSPGAVIAIGALAVGAGAGLIAATIGSVPSGPKTVGYAPSPNPPSTPPPAIPEVEKYQPKSSSVPSNQLVDLLAASIAMRRAAPGPKTYR